MTFKLETIIIFVRDVNRLKSFYAGILGLTVLEESTSEWLLLKAGNSNIGLHKIGDSYLDNPKAEFKLHNNTKIVFEVREDIHAVRQQLLAKNIRVKEVATFANYDFFICDGEDPEGNVFQLKQRRSFTHPDLFE